LPASTPVSYLPSGSLPKRSCSLKHLAASPEGTKLARALRDRQLRPARDHVYELLELLGRPALEDSVAVRLVGGHHRIAVIPVQAGLGIEPEHAAGELRDTPEHGRVRLPPVRSPIAEDDYSRPRSAGVDEAR